MTLARAWVWATAAVTAAAVATAIAFAPPAGASPARALTWLLFTGSSVHVASTGYLLTIPAVRRYTRAHPVRCWLAPAALIGGTAAAAALISPAAFLWLLLPYFGWQFWHYQKQNVGLAALAAAAGGLRPLGRAERWPLLAAGLAGAAGIIARPGLLGLQMVPVARPVLPFALAVYLAAAAAGLVALARRRATERDAGFCVLYLLGLAFSLPVFAFSSPYAAIGGLTVAHGLQYLLLVGLVAGAGAARAGRSMRLLYLANIALIGGFALSAASHLHDAVAPGRILFGAYLGVVMAHFVIDAGLWRMRDPLARDFVTTHLPFARPAARAAPAGATRSTATAIARSRRNEQASDPSLTDISCSS